MLDFVCGGRLNLFVVGWRMVGCGGDGCMWWLFLDVVVVGFAGVDRWM